MFATVTGDVVWVVTGANGKSLLSADCETVCETVAVALRAAADQAQSLWMLGTVMPGDPVPG